MAKMYESLAECEAYKLFMAPSEWSDVKNVEGAKERTRINGTTFTTERTNGKYQLKVRYRGDDFPCEFDHRSFPTLKAPQEEAWLYFRGRLLLEALQPDKSPPAKMEFS